MQLGKPSGKQRIGWWSWAAGSAHAQKEVQCGEREKVGWTKEVCGSGRGGQRETRAGTVRNGMLFGDSPVDVPHW